MSTPDEELVAQPGLLESLKSNIADRSHFIPGRPERKRVMKTKVIEHEWEHTDEDGWYEEGTLVAIKRASSTYTPPGETATPVEGIYWDIDGTDLKVGDADEARRYIKLLEKIIEDEENGD